MGNCSTSKKPNGEFNNIFLRVSKIIEQNDLYSLEILILTEEFKENFKDLNGTYFSLDGIEHTLLSISAWNAASDCFKYIKKTLGVDIEKTEKVLANQGTSLIEILCLRGNTELLEFYLPNYHPVSKDVTNNDQTVSIFLTGNSSRAESIDEKRSKITLTPIQKACEQGNINIIACVYKYYKAQSSVPNELNLNYLDDINGENCALIACRNGNYSIIRFLNQTCHCNFRIINKLGETAIQILAASNNKKPLKEFHECLVYLVNQAGVDILYNYEETIILIHCERSIVFLEKKLSEKGVQIDKEEIDAKNRIMKVQHIKSMVEEKLDTFAGKNFNFCSMYQEYMEDESDQLSNISSMKNDAVFDSLASDLVPEFIKN